MDESNPTAQGQDGAVSPESSEQQSSKQDPFAGVQKRIDELVAQRHEDQRRYQEMLSEKDQQVNQLMQAILSQQSNGQQAQQQVQVDPEIAAQVDAVVRPMKQQFEQQLAQANQVISRMAWQQEAAQYPQEVQKRASELMQQWNRERKTGWAMNDALIMASYQLGVPPPSLQKGQQTRAANGQFASTVLTENAAPPQVAPQTRKIPANIDSLPLEKQVEIYNSVLGDEPF